MSGKDFAATCLVPALLAFLLCVASYPSWSQQATSDVTIRVVADQTDGTLPPIWNYFGYDEPNYTYAPNGKKLLGELATLNSQPTITLEQCLMMSRASLELRGRESLSLSRREEAQSSSILMLRDVGLAFTK